MRARTLALACVLIVAEGLIQADASRAAGLPDLVRQFEADGLEPLPGQESFTVAGGVVGVLRGSPAEDEEKPYVLLVFEAGGLVEAMFLTGVGKHGLGLEARKLPPTLAGLGRHVIVAYWEDSASTGEGVLPLDQVAAHFDCSGVDPGGYRRLLVRATGSSPIWTRLLEQTNIPLGLNLELEVAPDLDSPRAIALFGRGIPGLQFVTVPSSLPTAETVYSNGLEHVLVGRLAAKVSRLDEPPAFQSLEIEAPERRPSADRPYTGTIPDYAGDVEGLRLGGVLEGGPAAEAGLRAGDVIVELGGAVIEDVYGYAEALDTLVIGSPVRVVFVRDGERLKTTLTPQARE